MVWKLDLWSVAIVIEGSQTILFGGSVWTQLLTAIVVGLLVAFALQVLLTSLGVAIGMSVLAIRASAHRAAHQELEQDLSQELELNSAESNAVEPEIASEPASAESSGVQLGFWAGFGVLLTVNTVLFAACFLAARFSQAQSPITGAIEGIVIWSAYLLILIWLSSTAVSSVVGSLLSITTGGFRRLIHPIGALFTPAEPVPVTETEMLATVRQEIQAAFEPEQLQSLIRAELQRFTLAETAEQSAVPGLHYQEPTAQEKAEEKTVQEKTALQLSKTDSTLTLVQQQLIQFLQHTDRLTAKRVDRRLREILDAAQFVLPDLALIPEVDRTTAMRLLMDREDLGEKQREKILNQIEKTWNEFRRSNQDDREDRIEENERNGVGEHSAASNPAIQQVTETALKTLAEQLPNSFTDNAAVERVMQQLPELLQQVGNQLPAGTGLAMLAMALMRGKDLLPEDGIDSLHIRQTLDRLVNQSGMADLNRTVVDQVDHLRDRSMQQIEQVQQTLQATADTLKTQTQEQLQATQKAATIAAWWLFLTVSTGAISAALAGAIANQI